MYIKNEYTNEVDIRDGFIKADVYWNLHKKCWSVRSKLKSGRCVVVAHENYLWMQDVKFVVSEAGRQRVLREKKKNVHAFARGYIPVSKSSEGVLIMPTNHSVAELEYLRYNPYKHSTFVVVPNGGPGEFKPIHTAKYISLTDDARVISWRNSYEQG